MKAVASFVVVLALGLLSFVLARQWDQLFPDSAAIAVAAECDLAAGICEAELPGGGKVSLSLSPRPIALMVPLHVHVSVQNSSLQAQYLDITGINMEMGLNRTPLKLLESGDWKGETILPVCSQRRMHWQARLQLADGEQLYHLAYSFHTQSP